MLFQNWQALEPDDRAAESDRAGVEEEVAAIRDLDRGETEVLAAAPRYLDADQAG
ncbi:hypothetical protein [Streptomyces eurythermus]|uniref:hypothetical protein n=1 Tax=Streptomyces eurythermus TaxID=42237 RepID=UPI0033C365B6